MELKLTDDIVTELDIQDIRTVMSRVNQYVTQNNLPVYVAKSKIENAGLGVYARRDIEANELVTIYGGRLLKRKEAKFLEMSKRTYLVEYPQHLVESINDQQIMKFNKQWEGTSLDGRFGFRLSEMGRWINSVSRKLNWSQNVYAASVDSSDNGKTWCIHMRALRNIKKGEELLWNYGEHYTVGNRCISCKLLEAAYVEQHDPSKQFCSHMCQKQFYDNF